MRKCQIYQCDEIDDLEIVTYGGELTRMCPDCRAVTGVSC